MLQQQKLQQNIAYMVCILYEYEYGAIWNVDCSLVTFYSNSFWNIQYNRIFSSELKASLALDDSYVCPISKEANCKNMVKCTI